ncbi:hypothetical protein [Mucilaginibacter gotjawali]|uniref:Uncharacterized protein n=2 Tax=Mucilaginibacter gotjawali TaxID=1550579 RepID=A0A839SCV3_9SPHI|nr:hypothetical protein [Mucilaginibacter gotjawali]MBB3055418.1 hypothetical protein [Mucilaginibacter gotjawali]BAU53304.1 hypothetical protein MgSA37_01471 [Mucilaginibacter gotjawali]
MKSDLDSLIELLEAEKQFLKTCIKDNTQEWEYLHAHYHSKALFKLNGELRILKKLKDPFYDEKLELERSIEIFKKRDKMELYLPADSYYEKLIKEYIDKLEKLNERKSEPFYDDQKIDDALFNLLEKTNVGFVLYLGAKDNLSFTFELSADNILEISLSVKNVLNVDYFFGDDADDDEIGPLNKFKGLGFSLNHTGNKLIYKYDMSGFKEASAIKILLSRAIYDIFTYAELDKPATLVYY